MLELRPTCENCNTPLSPTATDAVICSYECTYCRDCAELLSNICPNCGGGFELRPARPNHAWMPGLSLNHQPSSETIVHRPVDLKAHAALVERVRGLMPEER